MCRSRAYSSLASPDIPSIATSLSFRLSKDKRHETVSATRAAENNHHIERTFLLKILKDVSSMPTAVNPLNEVTKDQRSTTQKTNLKHVFRVTQIFLSNSFLTTFSITNVAMEVLFRGKCPIRILVEKLH